MNLPFSLGSKELVDGKEVMKVKYLYFETRKTSYLVSLMVANTKIDSKIIGFGRHRGDEDRGIHFSVMYFGIMLIWRSEVK